MARYDLQPCHCLRYRDCFPSGWVLKSLVKSSSVQSNIHEAEVFIFLLHFTDRTLQRTSTTNRWRTSQASWAWPPRLRLAPPPCLSAPSAPTDLHSPTLSGDPLSTMVREFEWFGDFCKWQFSENNRNLIEIGSSLISHAHLILPSRKKKTSSNDKC